MKKLICTLLLLGVATTNYSQDFFSEANSIKEGKYWVVDQEYRKDLTDTSDIKYELDIYVKAYITDIEKEDKEV